MWYQNTQNCGPSLTLIDLALPGKKNASSSINNLQHHTWVSIPNPWTNQLQSTLIDQHLVICPHAKVGWKVWRGAYPKLSTGVGDMVHIPKDTWDSVTKKKKRMDAKVSKTRTAWKGSGLWKGALRSFKLSSSWSWLIHRALPGIEALCEALQVVQDAWRFPLMTGET